MRPYKSEVAPRGVALVATERMNPNMASIVPGFDSLSKEDQDLASMLIKEDQGHLFSKWQATGDKEKINGFFEQVRW